MKDERVIEIPSEMDFSGDPEVLIRDRITPKALQRLYENLDSDSPNVVDRAISKAIEIDKRLARKDALPVGNTLNVLTFSPEHLKAVGEGLRAMFGGDDARLVSDGSAKAHKPRLHSSGVA